MSQIRKNIVANFAGSFWNVFMSVIFVPVYIKLMGIEAYGLVGVFASLLALFSILDMGLSATMTREMARLSASDPTGRDARGLTRTVEVIYWSVALILGFAVIALAGPIADYWVKPEHLEPSVVKQALMITGGVVALRWPVAFYSGGLRGLDRQPLLNLILSGCATLRGVGAVLVLWLISPTIQAFFSFQIAVSAVETSCLAGGLWWSLPGRGAKATFAISHLKRVWRFSAGMTGISVTVLLLMQTDKIILSKMLSLELFGYYTLAWTVSSVLLHIIGPIQTAVYPSLTRIVAQNGKQQLYDLYHRTCQMQIVFLVPSSLMLIMYGDAVLAMWSGDPAIVRNTGPILSVLAVGTCLNGFMNMPYLAQLAHGWTSLALFQNIISVIVIIPVMVVLTQIYQGMGAAYVWVILNAGYVIVCIQIMHRKILKDEKWNWYIHDVGGPSVAAFTVVAISRWIMPSPTSEFAMIAYVFIVGSSAFFAAAMAAAYIRVELLRKVATVWRYCLSRRSSIGIH